MTWRRYLITTTTVLISRLAWLSSLAFSNRRHPAVRYHQELPGDDLAFPVLNGRKANTLSGNSSAQTAERETHTLKIANPAWRVNYHRDRSVAILADDSGNKYQFLKLGKKLSGLSQRARAVVNLKSRPAAVA